MIVVFIETCLLGVFQIVSEMKTQEDLAKLEDLDHLSKEVVASGTASPDIYITIIQQEPDTSDVKENEIVDLNSDISKEISINDNISSNSHAITIKPEPSPVCYSCATCLEEFSCQINLKRHVKAAHWKHNHFTCPECDKSFPSEERLNKHVRNHSKVKPYLCPLCQKGFLAKHHRRAHINSVHKKLRPFFCSICERSFSNKQGLAGHIDAVHKKLRPFACNFCPKSFAQKGTLDKHVDAVH